MITRLVKIPLPQGQSIDYQESGINRVFLHLVRAKGEEDVSIMLSVGEDELSAAFGAMTHGKVFYTMSLEDLLVKLKEHVDIAELPE